MYLYGRGRAAVFSASHIVKHGGGVPVGDTSSSTGTTPTRKYKRWILLKITAVVLLLLPDSRAAEVRNNCALHSSGDTSVNLKRGDVMLAGILQLTFATNYRMRKAYPPADNICDVVHIQYLRHFLAFDFAIEEINKNPDILPNITLGYDMYDTCYFPEQAMQATMRALSGGVKHHWNYRCGDNGKIMAFIGHLLSTSSEAISQILNLYGYPQISYGENFNSKMNFPFFYHTAYGPNAVNKAILKLLKYFGWTWIGILIEKEDELIKSSENLKELNKFIRNLHFQTPSGDDIIFDGMGISKTQLELLHVVIFPNKTYTKEPVGEYNPNANESDKFFIRNNYNKWAKRMKEQHSSSCADTCLPGYRRAENQRIYCCSLCVPCSAGEYSYEIDADKCEQCPEDEWPNLGNTACTKRPVDFLSFHNILGSLLMSLIVLLYLFSIIILVIFIKYRKTPIVKANNRNLSYTILISLMLCFLCSLLFIGNPAKLTCMLQNIIFNLVFAAALSSILAKTITVIIAFNVTKPNNRFRILFRKMSQVICCVGEFSICVCWIGFYPPYPDRDSVSKPGILILYCNVGSHVIFYLALGYNSFLALLCFLVAYFAKKLPDRFNEAHHITFSMLVYCSVWISFIPVYISTKGKYMTAVQVFAILASSAGLLGFIFFPKCFIILFRPTSNVKKSLNVKI